MTSPEAPQPTPAALRETPNTLENTMSQNNQNNLCSLSTRRAPFCPACGQLASHWSEYRESTSTAPISTNVHVSLSWVCDACHFDVTVTARVASSDVVEASHV